jgi:hypothetical protein
MILMEALEKFGFGHSTSLLERFSIAQWGTVFHFKCLFDPDLRSPYEISLIDCTKVRWLIHSPEESLENLLSITDIQIKKVEEDRQEFIIYTEVFELIVICGSINICHTNRDIE